MADDNPPSQGAKIPFNPFNQALKRRSSGFGNRLANSQPFSLATSIQGAFREQAPETSAPILRDQRENSRGSTSHFSQPGPNTRYHAPFSSSTFARRPEGQDFVPFQPAGDSKNKEASISELEFIAEPHPSLSKSFSVRSHLPSAPPSPAGNISNSTSFSENSARGRGGPAGSELLDLPKHGFAANQPTSVVRVNHARLPWQSSQKPRADDQGDSETAEDQGDAETGQHSATPKPPADIFALPQSPNRQSPCRQSPRKKLVSQSNIESQSTQGRRDGQRQGHFFGQQDPSAYDVVETEQLSFIPHGAYPAKPDGTGLVHGGFGDSSHVDSEYVMNSSLKRPHGPPANFQPEKRRRQDLVATTNVPNTTKSFFEYVQSLENDAVESHERMQYLSRVTESLKTKLRHQGDEISLKTVAFLEIETSDRALMAKIDAIELKGVKREHDIIIVGELISSCERISSEVAAIKQSFEATEQVYQRKLRELTALKIEFDQVQEYADSLQMKLLTVTKEKNVAQAMILNLEVEKKALEEKLGETQGRISLLESDILIIKDQHAIDLKRGRAEASCLLEQQERKFQSFIEDEEKTRLELKKMSAEQLELQNVVDRLTSEAFKLDFDNKGKAAQCSELMESILEARDRNKECLRRIRVAENQLDEFHSQAKLKDAEIDTLRSHCASLENSNKDIQFSYDAFRTQTGEMNKQVTAQTQDRFKVKQMETEVLQKKHEFETVTMVKQIESLQELNQKSVNQMEQLESQCHVLKKKVVFVDEDYQVEKSRRAKSEREFEDYRASVKVGLGEFDEQKARIQLLVSELQRYKSVRFRRIVRGPETKANATVQINEDQTACFKKLNTKWLEEKVALEAQIARLTELTSTSAFSNEQLAQSKINLEEMAILRGQLTAAQAETQQLNEQLSRRRNLSSDSEKVKEYGLRFAQIFEDKEAAYNSELAQKDVQIKRLEEQLKALQFEKVVLDGFLKKEVDNQKLQGRDLTRTVEKNEKLLKENERAFSLYTTRIRILT